MADIEGSGFDGFGNADKVQGFVERHLEFALLINDEIALCAQQKRGGRVLVQLPIFSLIVSNGWQQRDGGGVLIKAHIPHNICHPVLQLQGFLAQQGVVIVIGGGDDLLERTHLGCHLRSFRFLLRQQLRNPGDLFRRVELRISNDLLDRSKGGQEMLVQTSK